MYRLATLRLIIYFLLTGLVLIISFFVEGITIYLIVIEENIFHYMLSPVYIFLSYCLTCVIFGVVHSQVVVRLTLPFTIAPGVYPHHTSTGRLVAARIAADGIFKSMVKVFTFIPFIWGIIIFPYTMRLYGLKCGKNVHIATRTYIETAGLVEIGDNSFIGYNSAVSGHTHENRAIIVSPTKVGKNCLVGTYSIVAPGCNMEDRSVLGAKSALLKGQVVPANQIWVGVPAKYLKDRE